METSKQKAQKHWSRLLIDCRSDLDTMSLDDLYNHLKVYESEVQKKSKSNSQNMAFISLAKHSSGNEEVYTTSVSTASTNVSPTSANIGAASISQETACAYIASQSNGSQIKFKDINQIDKDDMKEMDIKWYMALLSMRADRLWKKTWKKITIQGSNVVGFDKSNVECFNFHKMGHFSRECRAPRSQDRGRRDNFRQSSKDHALFADEEVPTEFALMAKTSAESEVFDNSLCFKNCLVQVEGRLAEFKNQEIKFCKKIRGLELQVGFKNDRTESLTNELELLKNEKGELETKLTGFQSASKNLESLLESQRLDKNKEGLGYSVVPPPHAQVYSPTKKDMSWTDDVQNRNTSVTKTEPSPSTISPKPFIKFVKATDRKFHNGNTKFSTVDMGNKGKAVKASACWFWKPSQNLSNKGGCKITGKGTIKTGKLEFENVYFVKDLKYNLFSVSQICDNKNNVLFTDTEFIVLGRNFKLSDDANVLLRTPRQHNMYSIDLSNIVPHKYLTCLVAKASVDECMLWHRRLGHLNFKTMNQLVRHNLVRGLPTKYFENDHTCTACLKGKQHKASCKSKLVNSVTNPLHTLHMDLFGPTSVSSISHKWYCLVVTDDFSRFTWTFFLKTKDETGGIIRKFITKIENLKDLKVKIIRCDNGREFRNKEMNDFYSQKGIKREFSNARTPQQSGTNSTNFSGIKDAASQEVKKDVSYLRYIAFPNWIHKVHLESSSSQPQDTYNSNEPESSRNFNPTATSTNPLADQLETLTVETPIPTVSSSVLTACLNVSLEPSSDTRLISKRVANQVETPSLDNILTLTNRFEDILRVITNSDESNGVEANVSNMETTITASPTPTLRIHKDHPKSQIIGLVDTLIQTRHKSKEVGEQSVIAIIHQKTDPALFQFFLFSCFLSQDPEFPAKVYKVEKAMYGLHQAPRAWYGDILKKFGYSDVRSSNIPMDKENPWGKDGTRKDVDLYLYRSMIGSLMYLTASRPDIMFVVCAYARHQTIVATSTTKAEYVVAASCYGQVLWIQNQLLDYGDCFEKKLISVDHIHTDENVADLLTKPFDAGSNMARLAFCDYHNMIATLEKYEHNQDFHQIVDFVEVSHIRYALTYNPTVYVSHIRQFWSTARIETTEEGTKILATVDGKLRIVSESLIRRNLKLNDEAGIRQFSYPWKYLIHTIMQCLSPKSIGFNEFSSNIVTALVCLATNRVYNFSKMIFDGRIVPLFDSMLAPQGEGSRTPTKQYTRRTKIAQSLVFPPVADEPASPLGGVSQEQYRDDAPIKGKRLDEGEEAAKRVSDDTEEMATILTSMDATSILTSGGVQVVSTAVEVTTVTVSIPTGSGVVSTASPIIPTTALIFTTTTESTPYTRRKGKEKMVESDTPKKKKLQEQIDVQVARELEEQMAREDQRMSKQIARDSKTLQRKPRSKKQKKDYYMAVIKGRADWKTKDFKGMSFEQIEAKFNTVWKQIEDFIPMGSKEEAKRLKRKGLRLKQKSAKKLKTSKEVPEEVKSSEEVPEEKRSYWKITRLGGSSASYQFFVDMLKHFNREDLNQLWGLVKETLSIRPATSDKEKELWVELKRMFEPDVQDYLRTHTQNLMHAPVEWKLYDTCGVHHVSTKDQDIFMLIEKEYPLRKGLAIVIICYKLQAENYSQMANDLIIKIHKIANRPRQQDD
nr:putative ribonuclease H-like domain-containing protein [Tanacetum cinerariifolium]GEX81863.1 putative ribonuclease H-like domain-containing protein [Tanacetum cinerariifolium]